MNQKRFRNIALIVLVVVLAGAAWYFVLRKPVTLNDGVYPVTLNDGVYKDNKYGFQFQVPKTWKLMPAVIRSSGTDSSIQSPDLKKVKRDYKEGQYYDYELSNGAVIAIYASASSILKDVKELRSFNHGMDILGLWINDRVVKVEGEDALIYDYAELGTSNPNHGGGILGLGLSINDKGVVKAVGEDAPTYDHDKNSNGSKGHALDFFHNDLRIRVDIQYNDLDVDGQKVFRNILLTFKFTK